MEMLHTAEIDMAVSVAPSEIYTFLTDVAWAIHSTYHTALKASPGPAIFGGDIPHLADWKKIGGYRQHQTNLNIIYENWICLDWDYKFGDKLLLQKKV